jgi:hypothetical protein
VPHEKSHAGVPAENGVVVADGFMGLRFFEQVQGFDDPLVYVVVRALPAAMVARLGAALPRNARIVSAVIRTVRAALGRDYPSFQVLL